MYDIIIISYATMHTVLVPAACTDKTIIYNLLKRLDSSTLRETMAWEAVCWDISVDYSYHHFHRVWAALYGVLLFPESKKVPLHVTLKLETKRGNKERKKEKVINT